jgi:hypothetical protein
MQVSQLVPNIDYHYQETNDARSPTEKGSKNEMRLSFDSSVRKGMEFAHGNDENKAIGEEIVEDVSDRCSTRDECSELESGNENPLDKSISDNPGDDNDEWKIWYLEQKRKASEERVRKRESLKPPKKGYIATGTELLYNGGPSFDPSKGCSHGFLNYLATKGLTEIWMNPADIGTVRITTGPDEWRGSSSSICGRRCVISSSRGTPDPWFAVELVVDVVLTHYSLRHGWCNGDGAMTSWILSASADGEIWTPVDRRVKEVALAHGPYAHGTWAVENCPPSRCFKVQMVGGHTQGRYYMYCSGFEIYGRVTGQTNVDSTQWGVLGSVERI